MTRYENIATAILTALTLLLAVMLTTNIVQAVTQPTTAQDPRCSPDCTKVVYISRYGEELPVQIEYLYLIPCLNAGQCVIWEDGSIGPRPTN